MSMSDCRAGAGAVQSFQYSKQFEALLVDLAQEKISWPNRHLYLEANLGGRGSRLLEFATKTIPEIEFHCGTLEPQTVLDFGCGTGATTAALAERCPQVYAFDIDTRRVEICKRRLEEHGLSTRVRFLAGGDVADLKGSFPDVDLVLLNGVIEHLPLSRSGLRRRILRALFEMLRTSGVLFINDTPNRLHPLDRHTTQLWWIPWTRPGSDWAFRHAFRKGRLGSDLPAGGPMAMEEAGAWGATYWEISGYLEGLPWECLNVLEGHDRHVRYRPAGRSRKRDLFESMMYTWAVKLCRVPLTAFTPDLTNLVIRKSARLTG